MKTAYLPNLLFPYTGYIKFYELTILFSLTLGILPENYFLLLTKRMMIRFTSYMERVGYDFKRELFKLRKEDALLQKHIRRFLTKFERTRK